MDPDQASLAPERPGRAPRFRRRSRGRWGRSPRLRPIVARLVGALSVALLAVMFLPGSGGPTARAVVGVEEPPVVFVGVAGLAWPDVTAETMPVLYELMGAHAAGSLSVRTVRSRTCVVDSWLTISSGRRASDLADLDGDGDGDRFCRAAPAPVSAGSAGGGDTVLIEQWPALAAQQDDNAYNAQLGRLGDRLAQAGRCATAVGPGAALALADSSGVVASYVRSVAAIDEGVLDRCPVTVIDLGGLPSDVPSGDAEVDEVAEHARRAAASAIDHQLGQIVEAVPPRAALLVAGIADSFVTSIPEPDEPTSVAPAGLRVAVAAGPLPTGGEFAQRWLTSSSTHWPGLVQLTDVTATLLAYAGVRDPSDGTAGQQWRVAGRHPGTPERTLADLLGVDRAAEIYRTQSGPLFQILGVGQLVLFTAAVIMVRRSRISRPMIVRTVYVAALTAASVPVASYLANITRWWRYEQASVVLWLSIAVITGLVTGLALVGPWRRRIYGPPGVVAGVTAVVLAVDVASGSSLQQSSLLGLSPLVAGRFYGFGNIPFAIFVMAALTAGAALGQWLIDRGRSRAVAAVCVGVVGLIAVAVDGAPQAGADVGGILAAVPGFAVLVLGTAGIRVTVPRVVLAGIAGAAVFVLVAWLDWLRPPQARTHFGGFFADILSGEAWTVMLRKAEASWGTLQRWPTYGWLVPLAYAVIIWLSRSPRAVAMREAVDRWPLMQHLLWAALITGAAGFATNDSGIIVPALLLTVGVSLGVTAVAAAHIDVMATVAGDGPREEQPIRLAPTS